MPLLVLKVWEFDEAAGVSTVSSQFAAQCKTRNVERISYQYGSVGPTVGFAIISRRLLRA